MGVLLFVIIGIVDTIDATHQGNARMSTQISADLFLLVMIVILLRLILSSAIASSNGVKVRNPLHMRSFAWDEIQEFTLYEPRSGPMYGRVELKSGEHFHIFAIMSGVMPYWEKKVRGQISELNDLLQRHQGMLASSQRAGENPPRASQRIGDEGLGTAT